MKFTVSDPPNGDLLVDSGRGGIQGLSHQPSHSHHIAGSALGDGGVHLGWAGGQGMCGWEGDLTPSRALGAVSYSCCLWCFLQITRAKWPAAAGKPQHLAECNFILLPDHRAGARIPTPPRAVRDAHTAGLTGLEGESFFFLFKILIKINNFLWRLGTSVS